MNCPHCNVYMDLVDINGFDMHWCFKCDGLWVGYDLFEKILTRSSLLYKENNFQERLNQQEIISSENSCPECKDAKLFQFNIDNVLVDQCPQCYGLYFDKGELNKLAPNVKREDKEDLNYQELPYSPEDYLDNDIFKGRKLPERKIIRPWHAMLLFILFMLGWLVQAYFSEL